MSLDRSFVDLNRAATARIALETAEALDRRLETFPPALPEAVYERNRRWGVRALHRDEPLDEAEAAL